MADRDSFSRLVASGTVSSLAPTGEQIELLTLARLDALIASDGESAVHWALRETILRLCETHILANPGIAKLIDVWDNILGSAQERITAHITEMLGVEPDSDLVNHVFRCLNGSAARRGRSSGAHQLSLQDVLERLAVDAGGRKSLRCECCGYAFRYKDLNKDKIRAVLDAGLTLENYLFPGRANDEYKPTQRNEQSFTQFSIDHLVPEETLGWSESDNLQILCMFCNSGKLAYRRPLECISTCAVGALAEVPIGRSFGTLKHQIVVAALRSQGGTCCKCHRTRVVAEMTVRPVRRTFERAM
jgi:hypothetical protein